uniref:DUF222 domain-containing protein n=1 Tax=Frankia sp. Cr2 TaxID=3073932 RepID=UPI002AD3B788
MQSAAATTPDREHPVLTGLDAVATAMNTLAQTSVWSLSDAELLAALEDGERLLATMAALRLRLVRDADGRDLAARHGATSTAALLRHRLRLRPGDARMLVELAAALDGPQAATGHALRAGIISAEQAWAIVRTVRGLPAGTPAATVGDAQAFLLAQAEVFDPAELTRLGAFLITRLADQDPTPEREKDPAEVRELWLTDTGAGTTRIRGTLDAEAAAILRAALDPLTAPRPAGNPDGAANPDGAGAANAERAGGAGGADNAGTTGSADSTGPAGDTADTGGERDRRSPARRRADALIELITRALHTDTLPTQGGYRPHVTVLAP